jgi:phenylacetate-coenzyme A ligase PaaK-like adenylate-forming protein
MTGAVPGSGPALISPVLAWTRARTGLGHRLGPETLAAWQLERAGRTVAYARTHSRFYARRLAGADRSSCATRAGLERLPFTWPGELAEDPLAFLCVPQSGVARVTTQFSSGTTGPSKRVFCTAGDLERTVGFFAQGMTDLVAPGQEALVLLPGGGEGGVGRLLQGALERIGVSGRLGAPGWSTREVLAAARGVHCLVGLPSELFHLCRVDPGLRPATVLLSGDYIAPAVVAALEGAWHCRVATHYGLTEAGLGGAVQCRAAQGHHLRDADLLFEVVDPDSGRPLAPGEQGEIVLTTLNHEAMPVIRYRTGDLGRMLPGPCPCGGPLPLLGRVEGRRDGDIALDGGLLNMRGLDDLLCSQPGVSFFTAGLRRGTGRAVLVLTLAADHPLDPALLAPALPPGVDLELGYAPLDPFAHRGKRRIGLLD